MKKYNNPVVIARGLLGALCIITTVLANSEIIYADSTTDDLKSYLGIPVDKHEEVKRYESNYNELIAQSTENTGDVQIQEEVELQEIDMLSIDLSGYGVELDQLLKADASPYVINQKLDIIKETKDQIKSLGYTQSAPILIDEDKYSSEKLVVYESENDINSRWYDIGSIGGTLKMCVDRTFIVRPFGYEVEFDDSLDKYVAVGDKNRSLWLAASVGDNVKAQFNGVVLSIEKDKNGDGTQNICIKHGNNVFTIYKHLHLKDRLGVGDHVKQYEVLGTAGKSLNEEYTNHIEIELIIDKTYINPLLMYGSSGKGMYENLIRSSIKEFAVEKGEGYYWTESMKLENPNKVKR